MKLGKLGIVAALLVQSGFAFGNGCTAPINAQDIGTTPINGNSCNGPTGGTASDGASLLCGNFDFSQKHEDVYTFVYGTNATATSITLTNLGAGFTPGLYISDSACTDFGNCLVVTGASATALDTTLTKGTTYFMIVSTTPGAAAANCGTYTIGANGSLPVKLEKFSVD